MLLQCATFYCTVLHVSVLYYILLHGREGRELVLGWGEGNMKWEEGTLRAEEWKGDVEEGREEVGDTRVPACLARIASHHITSHHITFSEAP